MFSALNGAVAATIACCIAFAPPAAAQAWPVKPVRFIVPNTPSGLADIVGRVVGQKLTDQFGHQVVVENRPGAGSTIGTAAVAKAPADGYTFLVAFDSHASNPHLFKALEYDTLRDFAPVSMLVRGPMILVANPGKGIHSVRDLVAQARAKPGAINMASAGPGSPSRLLIELLKLEAGVDLTNVQYKGAGPALADLVSGQVEAMFVTVPAVTSHLRAGRLHAVAITARQPSALVPGVPTMSEDYPAFVTDTWTALLAPARTPADILTAMQAALQKVLALADVRDRFAELGVAPAGGTADELDRWIRAESERWGKVIRERGITVN